MCQSPIELPFALALMIVARHYSIGVRLVVRGEEFRDSEPLWKRSYVHTLRIEPQAQLGEHRVDFRLTLDGSRRTEDGRLRSASRRMVVECDGHDFHERTKAQASHDRRQDRTLQSFGVLVYRYTGQDIWRDVFACATEALDALVVSVNEGLRES